MNFSLEFSIYSERKLMHIFYIESSLKFIRYFCSQFCRVAEKQAVMRRLNENQTSTMVRSCALGTDIRKDRIFNSVIFSSNLLS